MGGLCCVGTAEGDAAAGAGLGCWGSEIPAASAGMTDLARAGMTDLACAGVAELSCVGVEGDVAVGAGLGCWGGEIPAASAGMTDLACAGVTELFCAGVAELSCVAVEVGMWRWEWGFVGGAGVLLGAAATGFGQIGVSGRWIWIVVPVSSWLSALISPWWARMISRLIARPRPAPGPLRSGD